jgi:hypothetical protein
VNSGSGHWAALPYSARQVTDWPIVNVKGAA